VRKVKAGDPKKVVGYIRVSTEDQALGPQAQRAALLAWCERQGSELLAIEDDLGVSGGSELDTREGFNKALRHIEDLGAGFLLIAKRDRLARDVVIAATAESLVKKLGATIVSADGVGAGDGPEAQLMRTLVDAFAQYERALIRYRTRAALAQKRGRGERTGEVPYGQKVTEDGRLSLNPGEVHALERLRELRGQGLSMRQLAARMNEEGHPCRGTRWHLTTVQRLLSREHTGAAAQ
jgi:DNA invertase Pin-like site-specific DNA recombinase